MKNIFIFGGLVIIMTFFFEVVKNACIAFYYDEILHGVLNIGLAIVILIGAIIGASILATRIRYVVFR